MKKTDLPISAEARSFLLDLLEEAGIDPIPSTIREKMLADLAKRLDAKLTLAAISSLPKNKLSEFEDMVSENRSVLEISDYLSKNIPNVFDVYAQALVEFRKSYLK